VMITAPLAVMLYDRAFKLRSWRALADRNGGQRWLYLLLATTSAVCIALIASGPRSATVGFHLGVTWYEYLYSQAWAIAHYLRLVFWPSGLTLDYGEAMVRGWAGVPGLLFLTACGAATIFAVVRIDSWGWLAFTGALFFLLLAPSSSVVPIASEVAAERRIYLALACVIVVVVVATDALVRRWRSRSNPRLAQTPRAGIPSWAAIVVVALLTFLTFQRSREYAQPERLWREVVARTPANPRGYNGVAYGMLHERPPRVAEAIPFLEQALALDSTYLSPMRALAAIAVQQSRLAEARLLLERELALDPGYADAKPLLGIVLVALGKPDSAAPYLAHVDLEPLAEDDPTGETLTALGTTYMIVGRWADAASAFRRALAANPGKTDVKEFLGDALIRQGRAAEAVPFLEDAARSGSGSAFGTALLSLADAQTGNVQGSADAAAAAAAKGGNEPIVYVLAGRASLLTAHSREAESYFARAVRLSPGDPEVITGLASAEAALGKRSAAEQLYRRALALQPDYVPAQRALRDLTVPRTK
jgi:protein O-mannosyl-transferase